MRTSLLCGRGECTPARRGVPGATSGAALSRVDVGELARRAVEGVDALAAARGCAVTLGHLPHALIVHGDADALLRVLTNLLDNAIATVAGMSCSTRCVNGD